MKLDDSEKAFWHHFKEIITSFKTLEYKSDQIYLELETRFNQSEYQIRPSTLESVEERQSRLKVQSIIIEDVLARIKAIVSSFDTLDSETFEHSVRGIIIALFFYIDRYGINIKVTSKELSDEVPIDPARNQVERLDQLVREKGDDYNAGGISTLSYFICQEKSILHEIHKRAQRLLSLSRSGGEAKFESAPSTAFDLCAFAIFLLAYCRTFPRTLRSFQISNSSNLQIATLCYLRRDGKTLLICKPHTDEPSPQFLYNALGGKMESGETPRECVIREVYEESGLIPKDLVLKGIVVISGVDIPAYGIQDWYIFVYTAGVLEGELLPSSEGTLAWIDDNKILEYVATKGDKYLLERLNSSTWFEGKIRYENKEVIKVEFHDYST
jgi:8-oxo-dGTP diphosphatase